MLTSNRTFREVDMGVLTTVLLLILSGLIAIYSVTYASESQAAQLKFTKQFLWVIIGLIVLFSTLLVPIKFFHKNAYVFYGLSLLLLFAVLVVGTGSGTKRWIEIGPVWLQPSEFAKIGTLLALAKYLSHKNRNLANVRDILIAGALVFLPMALIIRQPDLGSALVFLALILPVLHWSGLSPIVMFVLLTPLVSLVCAFNLYTFFFAMTSISIVLFLFRRGLAFFLINFLINIAVGILTPTIWNHLKVYQQDRIKTFLGLVSDPHGLGYQVIQSKVTIGSGGFFGKGFLDGTQTHLRFLPEQHTDFIFCVIGEEFGFLGVFIVLALFFFLIFKGIKIAMNVKSKFSSIVVFGGIIILMFQVFVNIGMTIGIMPVTGLPLPFLSYGGSALLSNMILIGLILNASQKRFEYF